MCAMMAVRRLASRLLVAALVMLLSHLGTVVADGLPTPGGWPPISDDHGNDPSRATGVGANSTTTGAIETARDEDWFRVVTPGAGTLSVFTTGGTDTYGYLLDSVQSTVAYDDDGRGFPNFLIRSEVVAGTYSVRVRHFSGEPGAVGPYNLNISFQSAAILRVSVIGSGAVTSDEPGLDGGIYCPGKCAAAHRPGSAVTLRAHNGSDQFSGWTGSCGGVSGACTLNLDGDRSTTATFKPLPTDPDLVVKAIYAYCYRWSAYCTAYAIVRNDGGSIAGPSVLNLHIWRDGTDVAVGALAPGAERWVGDAVETDYCFHKIAATFGATVDIDNQVREANENNNVMTSWLQCQ